MDVGWLNRIFALLILLIFSAIFSGSEVALFSLDEKKLSEVKKGPGLIGNYIEKLLKYPRRLLVSILIGNTVVNVAASIISVSIALDIANIYDVPIDITLLIQIIVLTIIVILFAEITPKVWANKHPISFSKIIAIPLFWSNFILFPLSTLLSNLIKFATSRVKYDKFSTALSTSDITDLADIGVEKGTLVEEEHELIHGLVSFKSINVREVMTPRVDVIAVSLDISFVELVQIIKDSGHSRIPVYKDDLDSIVGIVYAKDLLPYLHSEIAQNEFNLEKVARECLFVPETKLISTLMQEFQSKNMHMSIVVDEYGGTSGIISLEDILEEIVGEIRDEFDDEEEEITEINENKFIASGKADIDEIENLLNIEVEIPNEDFETLGGFIFNHAGTIPDVGYKFESYGYSFQVIEIDSNRITKVEIEKIKSIENGQET